MREGSRSVRFRATVLATGVVVVALAAAAVALVALTRGNLIDAAEDEALTRAQAIADLVASGAVPEVLPGSLSAQLVGPDGTVMAATRDLGAASPLTDIEVAPGSSVVVDRDIEVEHSDSGDHISEEESERLALAVVGVDLPGIGAARVIAASPLDSVASTTGALIPLLAVGVPLLSAIVAAGAWLLIGRSFRPVEEMREEAEQISLSDLHRRITVPATRDEIARLGDTLNTMLGRLEGSVAQQRRFVADASHELRSPIAALVTMAEVAEADPGGVDVGALAKDVGIEAHRLAFLVDDLLTLARSDEGRLELRPVELDLAELLHQEVARVPGPIDASGVASVGAAVDRLRMGQAIRNLIDNARRHAASQVWVAAEEVGDSVRITVADDGAGIEEADRHRIFERFERLDDARARDDGGSGLGLSVVRAVVEAHAGTVSVADDDAYPGAVFRIELPS